MTRRARVRPGRQLGVIVLAAALWPAAPAGASDPLRGAEIYRAFCAYCHGSDGRPLMPTTPDFSRQERLMQSDLALLAAIRAGRGAMPAFRGTLRDREILDVIAHLRTMQ